MTVKKGLALVVLATVATAFGAIKTFDITDGERRLNSKNLPYGTAELIGFEALMCEDVQGTVSFSLGKKIEGEIPHVDYEVFKKTNKVEYIEAKVVDFVEQVTYWKSNVEDKTFDYTNKAVAAQTVYHGESGGCSIGFYTELITTPYPSWGTNYTLNVSSYNSYFTTNFVWLEGADTMYMEFENVAATPARGVRLTLSKSDSYLKYNTNTTIVIDHIVTNRWSEQVTRICDTTIIPTTALTNGCCVKYFDSPYYVFKGDILKCTSPISTNNPGQVRAVIRDDSAGTVTVTGD